MYVPLSTPLHLRSNCSSSRLRHNRTQRSFPPPPSIPEDPNYKWPLVIFSHGVGRGRLMYNTFCGEMASRSYVVCVIKHRDGTCPNSMISKVVKFACHQDVSN